MFFDEVLVENSDMRRVWRAGFGRIEEAEENTTFLNTCTNLEECVGSEDPNPRRRLSLRTASVLVEGAARIYRQELNTLIEDLTEVEKEMASRNKLKLNDSEGDTSTDSSSPSVRYDTPEYMRRLTPRHSNLSIQRPDNESIISLEAPDLSQSLSSVSKSNYSQQSPRYDGQYGQSAKRRKMTVQTNISPEYPSSPDLTTDRSSKDLISDGEPNQANDDQDLSIQRPDNESIISLVAPDLSQSLSSVIKSTYSQQSPRNDGQYGQSAKRRKMTVQTDISPEYPSSPDLTIDRSSEDLISDGEPNQANDDQGILQISEQPAKKANAEFHSDDKATRKTDQHEIQESCEEDSREYPVSPTFTDKFDFIAALPNYDPVTAIAEIYEEREKSLADKNAEEADKRNEFENVTKRKKVITATDKENSSAERRSDGNDVLKDSIANRVDLSPVLPTARKVLRNSHRGKKNLNRSVVKKDQATQTDDVSFLPNTSERDRNINENLPFGYLLIHDSYRSRYPSKIVISSLNPFIRNL